MGSSFLAILHFLYAKPHSIGERINTLVNSEKGFEMRSNLYIITSMSIMFSVYALIMSALAFTIGEKVVHKEFNKWYKNNDTHFRNLFAIDTAILKEDITFSIFIFAFVVISILINIAIISIRRANDSADDKCIAKCIKCIVNKCIKCIVNKCKDIIKSFHWELHVFFLLLPITTVAVHGNHIFIGFIHTPYHATGIGTLYGIIIITCIAILKISHHHLSLLHQCSSSLCGNSNGDQTQRDSSSNGDQTQRDSNSNGDQTQRDSNSNGDHTQRDSNSNGDHTQRDSNSNGDQTQRDSNSNGDQTQRDSNSNGDHTQRDSNSNGDQTQRDSNSNGDHTQRDSNSNGDQTQRDSNSDGDQTQRDSSSNGDQTQRDSSSNGDQTQRDSNSNGDQTQRDSNNRVKILKLIGEYIVLLLLSVVVIVVTVLFFAFIIALYFLLPINIAIDEAPNRLTTIYHGSVVVFAGFITYWIVIKQKKSPLSSFIRAKDKKDDSKEWTKKTYQEKEEVVADIILSHYSGESPPRPTPTSLPTTSSPPPPTSPPPTCWGRCCHPRREDYNPI